jgi:hypothetical protein
MVSHSWIARVEEKLRGGWIMCHTMRSRCRIFQPMGVIGIVSAATIFSPVLPATAQPIRVLVNGALVSFNGAPPRTVNGRVMVPLRGVFEEMGATVRYDAAARTVRAHRGRSRVQLRIGSNRASVNGRVRTLDVPAQVQQGRALVPLRFVSEAFGADVDWHEGERTVAIVSQYSPPPGGTGGNSGTTNPPASSSISVSLTTDKNSYRRGETVSFTITARNNSTTTRELNFSSGKSFDITVVPVGKADSPRWDWSRGMMFTMAMRTESLAPGETKSWEATWNQTDNARAVMPRGSYEARAKVTANGGIAAPSITLNLID